MGDIVCVIALIYNNMARNEKEFDYGIVNANGHCNWKLMPFPL